MHDFLDDLRYALRGLKDRPGFAVTAVVSLGLGVGLNTAIFGLVHRVLLKPWPVAEPERLVEIYTRDEQGQPFSTSSYLDFLDLARDNTVLSGLAGHSMIFAPLSSPGRSELIFGETVTGNYFEVLGVRPALGRALLPADDAVEGQNPVVFLSDAFWRSHFNGDPEVVGKNLRLKGRNYEVVGVAPASFTGTTAGVAPRFWMPTAMVEEVEPMGMQDVVAPEPGKTRREQRGRRWMFLTGRQKPGLTLAQTEANLDALMARLAEQYPATNERRSVSLVPANQLRIHPALDRAMGPGGLVLMAVVALVLLVACANVANMLLARGLARKKEISLRLSLGASRSRLVRQLLTESLLLALGGGALGLVLAFWASQAVAAYKPPVPIPLALSFGLPWQVFGFAFFASLLAALAFGLVPALRSTRPDLVSSLKSVSGSEDAGGRLKLAKALVVGQVAATLLLLVLSGLLTASLLRSLTSDLGFDSSRLSLLTMDLNSVRMNEEQGKTFTAELLAAVRALPEVEAAAFSERLPFSMNNNMNSYYFEGKPVAPDDPGVSIDVTSVGLGYFETLGAKIVAGRDFEPGDGRVVVVNQTMAERFWPGESALGKRLSPVAPEGPFFEVIGVASDHKVRTVGESPRPFVHTFRDRRWVPYVSLLVRSRGPGAAMVETLRRAALAENPELLLLEAKSMDELVGHTTTPARIGSWLFGAFGGLALLLAAVGLFGLVSYTVSRRTRELGIRQAIGASPSDLMRMVLGQGMKLVGFGAAAGLVLAVVASLLLSKVFYGIHGFDTPVYLGALALLATVAGLANLGPARRAAGLTPVVALRDQG